LTDAEDESAALEERWRADMERLGLEEVRRLRARKIVAIGKEPNPDVPFIDAWIKKKVRAGRWRAAWGYGIALFVSIVAMVAACIAAWPVIEGWLKK
jgi:hypothetical protein